jgi:hypothetical protein
MDSVAGGGTWGSDERPGWGLRAMINHVKAALRARAEGLPPIPRARPVPALELRRSPTRSAWDARLAVRSGVRLEDFLRHRLATYAAQLHVPTSELPVVVGVEGGEPVVRTRPVPPAYMGPTLRRDEARWLRALVDREGPVASREIRDAEADVDALDARIADHRRRADALAARLGEDLEAGLVAAPPRIDASPEQAGRPPVPHAAPVVALRALAGALLAAESWQLARPVLALSGHDAGALGAEAARDPVGLGLALAFALGAATSVFVLADAAVRRAAELVGGAEGSRRRRWLAAIAASAAAAAIALATVGAGLAPDPAPRAVLLSAIPFATALLLRAAAALAAVRAVSLEAALAWDRARVREAAERAQRTDALALARADVARLEAERGRAARRLRALQARAIAADRTAAEEADARARSLDRLSDALASALELDRYAFVRLASAGSRETLVRPARDRASDRFEPGMTPAAG